MKKTLAALLACIIAFSFAGCAKTEAPSQKETPTASKESVEASSSEEAVPVKGKIILSTTTSTQDSGLLDMLLPIFTKETGWEVDTVAVGTGAALKMGEDGEADVLLVHAKAKEEAFIEAGHGVERFDVMYNDFVVIGPKGNIDHNEDVIGTFKNIFDNKLAFVSRGDDSGTHTKELGFWKQAEITPEENPNYMSAGQGMGATILLANEKNAYTLSDRATWLTSKKNTQLEVVCEKDSQLLNYYGIIAVNPDKNENINNEGANDFIKWITSQNTQKLIGEFGVEEFGEALFTPNAK